MAPPLRKSKAKQDRPASWSQTELPSEWWGKKSMIKENTPLELFASNSSHMDGHGSLSYNVCTSTSTYI